LSQPTPEQAACFLSDLDSLCRMHGLSLAHEDGQGGFIITAFREPLLRWLMAAQVRSVEETRKTVGWPLEEKRP
jgi:hypothetical protein